MDSPQLISRDQAADLLEELKTPEDLPVTPEEMALNAKLCAVIDSAYSKAIDRWNKAEWMKDTEDVKRWIEVMELAEHDPVKARWKLRFIMPPKLYCRFQDMMPDGMRNFSDNYEFMAWLAKQKETEWLKAFPLSAKDPQTL